MKKVLGENYSMKENEADDLNSPTGTSVLGSVVARLPYM
jgi:hypothetical protein